MRVLLFTLTILSLVACSNRERERAFDQSVRLVQAKPYVVPEHQIVPPSRKPCKIDALPKIAAGKPSTVAAHNNTTLAVKPTTVIAGSPIVCTPGMDGFEPPVIVAVKDSTTAAMEPDIIEAKEMDVKDQNQGGFRYFSKLQGLKSDVVRSIHEDRLGNLWFGTWGGGISRYDGKSFAGYSVREGLTNDEVYSIQENRKGDLWITTRGGGAMLYNGKTISSFSTANGLLSDVVYCAIEDSKGRTWLGTNRGGVAMYDGKNLANYTTKQGLSSNIVYTILEDRNGAIWFGTWGGGVTRFDGTSFSHFTTEQGLLHNEIMSMLEDSHGNLWFGAKDGGVCMYDGTSFYQYTTANGLSSNEVYCIEEDSKGNLWFGTWGAGVIRFDGKAFTRYTTAEGLSNDYIYCIEEDRFSNLWIGTVGGGVSLFNGQSFSNYTRQDGLNKNEVYSILEDHNQRLWMGTWDGGLTVFDGFSYSSYTTAEGLSNNIVWSMVEDDSSNIWIGTGGGGVNKFDGKSFVQLNSNAGLPNDNVLEIFKDKQGNFWFGTFGGGVCKYDGKFLTNYSIEQGLSDDKVICITQDNAGNMWFGTLAGGVTKYDGNSFTHFKSESGLGNNRVHKIVEDESGNLWFATYGSGLVRFDGSSFAHVTTKQGLSNDYIVSMWSDSSGECWLGTRNGINRTNLKRLNEFLQPAARSETEKNRTTNTSSNEPLINSYGYSSGFTGIGCKQGAMMRATNGTMWVGTDICLTEIKIEQLIPDTLPPNIQLTALDLYNEKVNWIDIAKNKNQAMQLGNGVQLENLKLDSLSNWYFLPEGLSLAYNNNYISFRFVGITMHEPDCVKYRYKLEGINEEWSSVTDRNEAPYGNLPPGDYTFHVMAVNSDGLWSEPYKYSFTIRPPWWQTWWAWVSYVLIIIISILSYVRFRERNFRKKQKELELKVDEATTVIRKQKEEVEQQKDEADLQRRVAEEQKHVAEEQRHLVQEKNREILDSIEYAKRIQTAILPPPRVVKEYLKNSFVLYLPKDIVAGDFYWMESIENQIYFAACDCTGHGVPGAMVSVVCNNALSRAVNEFALRTPGEIFEKSRELVVENFAKSDEEVKDGMDASLCVLDTSSRKVLWAGANNPIWIYRAGSNTIEEIKADKQPIGMAYNPKPFTTHELQLQEGDIIYLFTDGYADQFGGENNKKLTRSKFREILLTHSHLSMDEQRNKLLEYHDDFRGTQEQVDDICVIGVKM